MRREFLLFSIIPLLIGGCSNKTLTDPTISMKEPNYVSQTPSKKEEVIDNEGSIFGKGYNPLFTDIKAMKVGDIVIVNIQEQVESQSEIEKELDRNSNLNLGGGFFQPAERTGGEEESRNTALTSLINKVNGFTGVGFNSESASAFNGEGTQRIAENFQTTIACRIEKVLRNGNYYIEGKREIMINREKQMMLISGIIRPYDIDADNTINSQFISDARVIYDTEGELRNSASRGIGAKVVDAIWPF